MKKISWDGSSVESKRSGVNRLLVAAAFSAVMSIGVAGTAAAGPVAGTFTTNTLPANDDGSTGSVVLPFSLNYFGTTYTSLFVNNNGNVSFNNPVGTFTPSGVAGGYSGAPIISPFFADVDTRGAGSGLVQYGAGTYNGFAAFGVEWPAVGYFGAHVDQLNTFELILTNRSDVSAGDFDIYFNYNTIVWETGDASGGAGGHGGTSPAVGFSNGTGVAGTYYSLPGSLVNGAFVNGGPNALISNTNDGVAGQYLFQVRNGGVIVPPITGGDGAVPEPTTWAMMILGMGGIGAMIRRRRNPAAAPA